MTSFKVESVLGKREWESKFGTMIAYDLELQKADGTTARAEWSRKQTSAEPKLGERLEGELESAQFGMRFKQEKKQNGGGSFSRQEDPKRSAEIRRMASQKCALELLRIETDIAIAMKDEHSEKLFAKLRAEGGLSGHIEARTSFFESHARAASDGV